MAIGLVYLSTQNATSDDHVMDVATGGSSYPLLLGITCGGVCLYFNLIGFVFVFVGGGRGGVSCLFVCLWFIVSLENFPLIWRHIISEDP